jgi:hypothetical protein
LTSELPSQAELGLEQGQELELERVLELAPALEPVRHSLQQLPHSPRLLPLPKLMTVF